MKTFLAFVLILAFAGCSRQQHVTGEIFIVTQGGQNYKLGLVKVGLVNADKFTPYLDDKLRQANQNILPIYGTYMTMKDSSVLLNTLNEELDNKKRMLDISDRNGEMLSVLSNKVEVAFRRLVLHRRISPLEDIYQKYTSSDFFLSGLPQLDDSSKTDSDGQFNLVVQKDAKYFIIASASRNIGDKKEYYYWIIEYPNSLFREGEKILLSNDNLFDPPRMMRLQKKNVP